MPDDRPSTPTLIGDAIRQASGLVTAEMQLARLEVTEKLTMLVVSLVSLVVAAIFIIVALIFLLTGLVGLLAHLLKLADWQASLIVGGAVAVIALIAIIVAALNLSAARLKPKRTIRQVQQASEIVRGAR